MCDTRDYTSHRTHRWKMCDKRHYTRLQTHRDRMVLQRCYGGIDTRHHTWHQTHRHRMVLQRCYGGRCATGDRSCCAWPSWLGDAPTCPRVCPLAMRVTATVSAYLHTHTQTKDTLLVPKRTGCTTLEQLSVTRIPSRSIKMICMDTYNHKYADRNKHTCQNVGET